MTRPLRVDERTREFGTDKEKEYADAIQLHGTARHAAKALGVNQATICKAITRMEARAARGGYAPGHWDGGTPAGYLMGKVTIQRKNDDGTSRWERMSPEMVTLEAMLDRCEERLKDFPRFKPLRAAPCRPGNQLTNFLGLFDLHIGAKITADDPTQCWDIATAKQVIIESVTMAIHNAPKAKRLVLCFGGDVGHFDGLEPVTPRSKHVLHSDGSFDDLVDGVLDVATACIDLALKRYEEVYLIWAEGNHDQASSVMMRKMLPRIYAAEPRLTVLQSKTPFYALRFGKVMIGVHHGHGAKLMDYAGIFASMFRKMWGDAEYAYAHRGHEHHIHSKERGGMISDQHPSLCPSDDYASGKGLISNRGCMMMTYHDDLGEISRSTTRPEMLLCHQDLAA